MNKHAKSNLFEKFADYQLGELALFTGGEPIETTTGSGGCDSIDYDTPGGATCNGRPCDYTVGVCYDDGGGGGVDPGDPRDPGLNT